MSDDSPPRQRWWNIEGWGLRWKVTAVLAIPVTVAMVLGGLRIQEELTNAVHFSQAADQVAHVPDLVDFGTALGTLAGTTAAGLSTPEEVARLDETLEQVRTVALNPELDPVVAADLTRVLAGAEALRDQMKAGQGFSPEMGKFSTARRVCAPYRAPAGTWTSPSESRSTRVSAPITINLRRLKIIYME